MPASQRLLQMSRLLGLVRPQAGSLGLPYLVVFIAGCVLAALLGSGQEAEARLDGTLLISLILWQPMIEELLFRGVLQGELLRFHSLARPFMGMTPANVIVSCAFVAVHLVNQPPGWAVATVVPSLIFGFFRDRSLSVLPGLLLHAVFNGVFFLSRE